MKKGQKKKQLKALKKRKETKSEKKQTRVLAASSSVLYHIRRAREYPIEGCWAQKNWQKDNEGDSDIAVVVIARRQPNGNIVFGSYLVDRYCLGLKSTFCNADIPPGEFHREYLPDLFRATDEPIGISPALAHEIVYGGIEYAAKFGFKPERDFRDSQYVLDPPDAHPRSGGVEFGRNGKPFFIAGPYDNADAIVRQLMRTAGEGNFEYLIMLGESPEGFFEEDESEE